jgi:hypothetical protein
VRSLVDRLRELLAGLRLLERTLVVLDLAAGLVGIGWLPPPTRAPGRGGSLA